VLSAGERTLSVPFPFKKLTLPCRDFDIVLEGKYSYGDKPYAGAILLCFQPDTSVTLS